MFKRSTLKHFIVSNNSGELLIHGVEQPLLANTVQGDISYVPGRQLVQAAKCKA